MNAQAAGALDRANQIRVGGAVIRREISALPRKEAMRHAAKVLLNPPEPIQRMRVRHFIRSLPYVGPIVGARLMADAGIYNSQAVIGPGGGSYKARLTVEQRQRLVSKLLWIGDSSPARSSDGDAQ